MAILDCLIPVHNDEGHLQSCLENILSQTFQNFNILIYDAESTDNSLKIIQEYQKKDARIQLFKGCYKSLPHSLNFLIKQSRSKYIAFQYPGDTSDISRFEKQIQRMKNSSLVALGTSKKFSEKTDEAALVSANPRDVLDKQISSIDERSIFMETTMYLSSALKKALPIDETLLLHFDLKFHAHLQKYYPLRIANLVLPLYFQKKRTSLKPLNQDLFLSEILPILLFTKHRYLDNVLVTAGFVPY